MVMGSLEDLEGSPSGMSDEVTRRMKMNVTEEQLRAIVKQEIEATLQDLGMLMPLPLEAEPINEGKLASKLIQLMGKASPEDRKKVFNHYGFYSRAEMSAEITKNVLRNISNIKSAEKGPYQG